MRVRTFTRNQPPSYWLLPVGSCDVTTALVPEPFDLFYWSPLLFLTGDLNAFSKVKAWPGSLGLTLRYVQFGRTFLMTTSLCTRSIVTFWSADAPPVPIRHLQLNSIYGIYQCRSVLVVQLRDLGCSYRSSGVISVPTWSHEILLTPFEERGVYQAATDRCHNYASPRHQTHPTFVTGEDGQIHIPCSTLVVISPKRLSLSLT